VSVPTWKLFPWRLSWCTLRQLDTGLQQIPDGGLKTYFGHVVEHNIHNYKKSTGGTWLKGTSFLPPDKQQVMTKLWKDLGYRPSELSTKYTNMFGQEIESWDFQASSGVAYPGSGGQVITDTNGDCYTQHTGQTGCIYQGMWLVDNIYNGTQFTANYDREIATFNNYPLFNPLTSLVQVSCNIIDTNNALQAFTTYSMEMRPSGNVEPMEPQIIIANYPILSPNVVYYPLILSFYIFCEELQDIVVGGWREYFVHSGWLNLMDILAVVMLLLVWIFDVLYYGMLPVIDPTSKSGEHLRGDNWWNAVMVQNAWQTCLGLAMFAVVFKGLKFTHNVPIMSHIGNTFSHTLVDVSLFLFVVMVMLLGFAFVFNLVFVITPIKSFDDLGTTLFSLFRGLLGDLDIDGMQYVSPTLGPLLYTVYVTVVLFIAFTILIAIVCESFAAVMDQKPEDGVIVQTLAWYNGLSESDEEADEDEVDTEEMLKGMRDMMINQGRRLNKIHGDLSAMKDQAQVGDDSWTEAARRSPIGVSPLQKPDVSISDQQCPTDRQIREYFDRYDLDMSGTMNSHDEIRQLTINLASLLPQTEVNLADHIRDEVAKLPEDTCWSVDEYTDWFYTVLKLSK